MIRLFAAIAPPDAVRDTLALARGGIEGARWVDPSDYHVTLRFVGDVDDGQALRTAEALARVEAEPFTLRLGGYDVFGGDRPHLLHLAVEPSPPLVRLHEACEAVCRSAGLEPETRKYAPHITLARLKAKQAGAVGAWLSEHVYAGPKSFEVTRFGLYTAKPGGGAPYGLREEYPLGQEIG